MHYGRTLMSFIGLTVMLLSAELWLIGGLAAQGSRIVFRNMAFDNYEIYVMDADGRNRENLSNHPMHDMDPDWSPDGTKIAFVSDRDGGVYQIYVMDADGTNQIRLTDGPPWQKGDPDWSPDGKQIAFSEGVNHIAVMNADGDNRVMFEKDASEPTWSPDGKQIAFRSRRDGGSEIYVIGVDGQGLERVTHDFLGGASLSFSPNGRRIACYASDEKFFHIYVMGADGKNRTRLTRNEEDHRDPAWSPDGGTIAYVVSEGGFFGAKIHLMTADGKYIKRISTIRNVGDDQPDFSPVGLAVSPTSKTAAIWGRLKKRDANLR